MFLHLSVILSTGGVCLSACWDTHSPLGRHPPPVGRHPTWADTPPSRHPPQQTAPPGQTPPPGRHPPPSGRLPQRTVRILLECILVIFAFAINISIESVSIFFAFFVLLFQDHTKSRFFGNIFTPETLSCHHIQFRPRSVDRDPTG